MAVNTANYNLKKPSQEDFYNIEDHNGNMDIIDTQIKRVETELEGHLGDTQSHVPHLGTTVNNGNTYTIDSEKTISDGSKFSVKFNSIATGPATLSISSDGLARSLKKPSGEDFKPKAGIYSFIRDGENFQLLGEGGEYGNVTAPKVSKGFTFGTENGLEVGTLDIPEEGWFQPHNQWYKCTAHPATNGSDAIKGLTGCVCDNKLYLFSFFLPASASNYWGWNVYDPTTNLWTKDYTYTGVTPSYSTYICGVFNHIIYIKIADGATTSTTDKIYSYDTISKTMSSFTIKTLETHDSSSRWIMTDENTFYSIGGASTKLTYSYNRITDTITPKANCPVYLYNPSCVYNPYNNTIYVVGIKSTVYDQPTPLYAYDCSANTWVAKADYATDPRYNLAIILKDANTLYIGGGMKTTDWWEGSFKVYDITTNTYAYKPYSPIGKQVGSLGIINNKVYFFGGWTSNGGYDNTYVYFY